MHSIKWMSAALMFLCLNACFKHEEVKLSGPTMIDSSGALLTFGGSLRNVETARIVAVVDRQLRGALPDTCGSPSVELTANVIMGDGRRVVFAGRGSSPCNAEPRPTTETIDLRSEAPDRMPQGTITSIKLRSLRPVTLESVEWQTWEQGI